MPLNSRKLQGPARRVVAALFAYQLLMVPAASQTEMLSRQLDSPPEPLPVLQRDGPWLKVCEARPEGERCRYEQTALTASGAAVVLIVLAPPPGEDVAMALVRTPLEVLLPAGLAMSFDGGAPGRIQFRSCSRAGCLASAPLEGEFRSLMARRNRVTIEFLSQNEQAFAVEFSLARSAAILNAM